MKSKRYLIIYLDESYDQPNKRFLLLGLLFCPSKKLHRQLTALHNQKRCLDKHNNILLLKNLEYGTGNPVIKKAQVTEPSSIVRY